MSIARASAIDGSGRGRQWHAEQRHHVRPYEEGGVRGVPAEGVQVLGTHPQRRGTVACRLDDERTRGGIPRGQSRHHLGVLRWFRNVRRRQDRRRGDGPRTVVRDRRAAPVSTTTRSANRSCSTPAARSGTADPSSAGALSSVVVMASTRSISTACRVVSVRFGAGPGVLAPDGIRESAGCSTTRTADRGSPLSRRDPGVARGVRATPGAERGVEGYGRRVNAGRRPLSAPFRGGLPCRRPCP